MPKKIKSKNKNKNKNINKNKNNIIVNVNSNNKKKVVSANTKKAAIPQPTSAPIVISNAPPQQISNPYLLDHIHQNNTNGLGVQRLIDSIGGLTRIQAQQQEEIQKMNNETAKINYLENEMKKYQNKIIPQTHPIATDTNDLIGNDYVMIPSFSQRGIDNKNVMDENVNLPTEVDIINNDDNISLFTGGSNDGDDLSYSNASFLDSLDLPKQQDDLQNTNFLSPLNLMAGNAGLKTKLTQVEGYRQLPDINNAKTFDLTKDKPDLQNIEQRKNLNEEFLEMGNIYNLRSKDKNINFEDNPLKNAKNANWGGSRKGAGRKPKQNQLKDVES
jgi:hypothetical protein